MGTTPMRYVGVTVMLLGVAGFWRASAAESNRCEVVKRPNTQVSSSLGSLFKKYSYNYLIRCLMEDRASYAFYISSMPQIEEGTCRYSSRAVFPQSEGEDDWAETRPFGSPPLIGHSTVTFFSKTDGLCAMPGDFSYVPTAGGVAAGEFLRISDFWDEISKSEAAFDKTMPQSGDRYDMRTIEVLRKGLFSKDGNQRTIKILAISKTGNLIGRILGEEEIDITVGSTTSEAALSVRLRGRDIVINKVSKVVT
jgi:hypothetical protein